MLIFSLEHSLKITSQTKTEESLGGSAARYVTATMIIKRMPQSKRFVCPV
jgi:hypothetical protein